MKLRVQHANGRVETLILNGPVEVAEGDFQNRITDRSGLDHYFTRDGFYDGWGGSVCSDEQTAEETIAAMEQKRSVATD